MGGIQLLEMSSYRYVRCPVRGGVQLHEMSSYVRCLVM